MAASVYSAAPRNDAMSEINITPLVDVMLVLLVIFMIAAPVVTRTLPMNLPQGHPTAGDPPKLSLQVTSSGEFALDGRMVPEGLLRTELSAIALNAPGTVVEIGASADSDYQGFATALAATQASGLANISLAR